MIAHDLDRINARPGGLVEYHVGRLRAAERLFHRRQAERNAGPTGDRGLHHVDAATLVETDNGGRGGEREIAMPPGDLDESAVRRRSGTCGIRAECNVLVLGKRRFERRR